MFVFFSSALSNATQRFLTYELGKEDYIQLNRIFSSTLEVYVVIGFVVMFFAEIVGLWLLNYKLVIPAERMEAAKYVFHFSVAGIMITLLAAAYDSVLISRENMKIYAYIGIAEAVLKLLIVYMLAIINLDKLILYSFLFFCIMVLILLIKVFYCRSRYSECKWNLCTDTGLFRQLFSFIGWNIFGTGVVAINNQGTTILLNMFFGPVVNAARGIAQQIDSAVNSFTNNFFTAVKPPIIKAYAAKNMVVFTSLVSKSSKYSYYLFMLVAIPLILRIDYVLGVWLGNYPNYTAKFSILILIYSCVNVLVNPIWCAMQAIGYLKKYILIGSTVFLMAFPISYIMLKVCESPYVVFYALIAVRAVYLFVCVGIFKQYVAFSVRLYLKEVILPTILVSLVSYLLSNMVNVLIDQTFIGFIIFTCLSVIISIVVIFLIGLKKNEQLLIIDNIKKL